MARQAPKVLDGTRGPKADRIDDMRAGSEAAFEPSLAIPKVDGTVYLSMYPMYRIQVTAPADITDPITGRKTIGRPTVAAFAEGRYVNNAKDPKLRKHIDEVLQSNSRFGKPGSGCDFWLAEDAIRMTKAAAVANAKATLRQLAQSNPDEFREVVAAIQQGDATDEKMPAPPSGPGVQS